MAAPSQVAVPRPSSSRMTSDLADACLRIAAVSRSSTMNVDWPMRMRSDAPRRVKTRSTGLRRMALALTKQPACARIAETQTWRSNVDLPPMFGPDSSSMRGFAPPTWTSLAMTSPADAPSPARQGWAPSSMATKGSAPSSRTARAKPGRRLTCASASRASSVPTQATAAAQRSRSLSKAAKRLRIWSTLAAAARFSASSSASTSSATSGARNDRHFLVFVRCVQPAGRCSKARPRAKNCSGTSTQ
mmetsp:Transcript_8659/g.28428  ORF Transcript_8659/g.28428 Transcript_8659/m.28428 type:complete len:246 (-) Transcript_8659:2202-2939(-)